MAPQALTVAEAAARAVRHRPGAVVGRLGPGGERTVAGAGRLRTGGPGPDGGTLFEIGSVTKVFTALLLAEAVRRGEVALETPLADLLPVGTRVPSRSGAEITLRHLATHTSGLPRLPMRHRQVAAAMLRRDQNPYASLDTDGVLAVLARTDLRRTPGEGRMHYSNFGAGLLGLALVRAAGVSDYEALVRSRVCLPLGLADTVVTARGDQVDRLAQGHIWRGRPTSAWDLPGIPGAGALRSTADDLLTFAAAYLGPDDHPLGEAMRTTLDHHGVKGIGLGWQLHAGRPPVPPLAWHNGGTGGFRSFVGLARETGEAVVVLTNSTRGVDLLGLRMIAPRE